MRARLHAITVPADLTIDGHHKQTCDLEAMVLGPSDSPNAPLGPLLRLTITAEDADEYSVFLDPDNARSLRHAIERLESVPRNVYRSAETGRYVTEHQADTHPDTTVQEQP